MNAIYVNDFDAGELEEIYEHNREYPGRLVMAYAWKNNKEMYVVIDDNLILYNCETKAKEMIVSGLGKVYFDLSSGEKYLVYQEHYAEKREFMLMNMQTGEKKVIHNAKSDNRVRVVFSPDGKYIFLEDRYKDFYWGK